MTRAAAARASAAGSETVITWRLSLLVIGLSTELAPAAAVAPEQFLGAGGTFAAGLVILEPPGARLLPGIKERLHRLPAGLHAVGALEQDVVADHAVVDQRLIAGRGLGLEVILVAEFHLDAVDRNRRTRHLGVELQRDAFGRLDADDKIVLRQPVHRRVAEHREWRLLELDRDLG